MNTKKQVSQSSTISKRKREPKVKEKYTTKTVLGVKISILKEKGKKQ
jgi:hypothetical protein